MKKLICAVSIIIAVSFTIFYMHFGGIHGNSSALSKVGLTHPIFFALWGILTYFALAFNLCVGFSKTKYKFYIPFLAIAGVGMILTLSCDFDYNNYPQYLAHCIGSLTFSSIMGVTIFLLFLLTKRYTFSAVCAVILIADLVLLLIYKETALIEVVPIFAGYILLAINNLRKERELIEA